MNQVLTNPDLFTNILSYIDKKSLKSIVPSFKKWLHYDYIIPENHILLYGQVQSGKTSKIMNYIKIYKPDIVKILIIQNSINMQEQYVKTLGNQSIKYKVINTNALSTTYNNEQVLITIYNKYRMNVLMTYMMHNNITNYCLILDESDQYLDKIKTSKLFNCCSKNILHVTATPFKYVNKFNVDDVIQLNPSSNYIGFDKVDIESVNLLGNADILDADTASYVVKNKIIDILRDDFLQKDEGFMLINCFSRINKMRNVANELSNIYNNVPIIVLSSTTYITINGVTERRKTKNIQHLIDSFNMHPHVVFIANKLSNRGINYTNTNYSRNISHQISMASASNYTGFLQKCRIFGIRNGENDKPNPKIYCLVTKVQHFTFVSRLKKKIDDLFTNLVNQPTIIELNVKITVKQLKQLCRENRVKGFSKLRKQELIELLQENSININ